MDLQTLRELTKDLPGDTDVILHAGDLDFHEANHDEVFPRTTDNPPAFSLYMGQPVNLELDLDARLDAKNGD